VERVKVCLTAGCTIGKHGNDGKAEPRDTLGRKLACLLSLCVSLLSLRDAQRTVPAPIGPSDQLATTMVAALPSYSISFCGLFFVKEM